MARIGTQPLASLCRRVGIALESGIDERKIWQRESERATGNVRVAMDRIYESVADGHGVSDGVEASGRFFPPLFRELVPLGEQTGKQAAVFRRMADHFEHRVKLRRDFLSQITGPMTQLCIAVLVVGLLIWIFGFIAAQDPSGIFSFEEVFFGLSGTEGLVIYILIVATVVATSVGIYFVVRSGAAWTRPIQRLVMRIPAIGHSLRILALSRIAWTLGLTLEAGMDVRKALPFALKSTALDHFARHADAAAAVVNRGDDVFTAMAQTGAFPDEFLDALQVGEQSGRLDESMLRLADVYQEQARAAIATLTQVAGYAVWALVALIIVIILYRVVSRYAAGIQNLANPRRR